MKKALIIGLLFLSMGKVCSQTYKDTIREVLRNYIIYNHLGISTIDSMITDIRIRYVKEECELNIRYNQLKINENTEMIQMTSKYLEPYYKSLAKAKTSRDSNNLAYNYKSMLTTLSESNQERESLINANNALKEKLKDPTAITTIDYYQVFSAQIYYTLKDQTTNEKEYSFKILPNFKIKEAHKIR